MRLAIHENFRWQSPMRKLKGVLDSGAIGKPTWARIAFRTGYDIYAVQPYLHQAERYAILDVGIHVLDLARFFLGDVERVSCETQTRNPRERRRGHGDHHDAPQIRRGQRRRMQHGVAHRPRPVPGNAGGDRRRARLGLGRPGPRRACDLGAAPRATLDFGSPLLSWTSQPWHTVQESVLRTQEAILRAWRAGKDPESTGDDNLKTYALVEAAYEAARQGRAVTPPSTDGRARRYDGNDLETSQDTKSSVAARRCGA